MVQLNEPDGSAGSRKMIGWLWRDYFRSHAPMIFVTFILMALEGGMLGLLSFMVRPMFDDVFMASDRGAVIVVATVIFGVFVVRAFSGFSHRVLTAIVGERVTAAIQADLLRHMMSLDSVFFQDNAPGALIERLRGDTLVIQTSWSAMFLALGRDVIALLSLFYVVINIDVIWTLIAISFVPLLFFPLVLLQKRIRKETRRARAGAALISTRLDEVFHGINPIKLNNMESQQDQRFLATLKAYVLAQIRSTAGQAGVPVMMDLVAGLGFFWVLYYGGLQIIAGEKTVGEFMSFFTAMALMFDPLRRLGYISGAWQAVLASIERIHAIFEARPGILSPANPVLIEGDVSAKDIVLDNVSFAYGELPVLDDVSFRAEAGKTTALVGASGAGKSTVFNVLTRLVEPESGRVTIGETQINALSLNTLRRQFSVVTQDAALFDETLHDNIVLGRPDAGDAALENAARAAFVSDFASKLPEGLQSEAGPRGSNLSGGQRQRVAIARAILRDAPILLMDEPTSALDAQSEAVVQKALDKLSANRTTLVIAHRLATILHADKIVVMDKGRVVDEGTHDELLARDGLYAGLYRLQFAS